MCIYWIQSWQWFLKHLISLQREREEKRSNEKAQNEKLKREMEEKHKSQLACREFEEKFIHLQAKMQQHQQELQDAQDRIADLEQQLKESSVSRNQYM